MKKILFLCLFVSALYVQGQPTYFYVGSATDKIKDPITLCSLDLSNGKLSKIASFEGTKSSSYLCVSPGGKYLYAVSGENLDPDSKSQSVASFRIDDRTKSLELLNKQSVEGRGACHLSVTSDNSFLMVANYSSGNVVILPIKADGSLEPLSDNKQHAGTGPDEKRQNGPHAHYIQSSVDDNYVFAVDLGIDKVMNYRLDKSSGKLFENSNQAFLQLPPGAGPRHMVIHTSGKSAYILNELESSISACKYDSEKGTFTIIETHPMLPDDFNEFSKAAAIRISPTGRYVYGSNRGHESIAVFEIKSNWNLKRIQIISDGIEWPRDYNIDATAQYMIVANRHKNELRSFRIGRNGKLSLTENTLEVPQPTSVVFLAQ